MQQLTQNLKSGDIKLLEVPFPALLRGQVMVRNHYSVISAGTEGKRAKVASAGYLTKAKERPRDIKRVLESIKSQGLLPTYRAVMNKLNMPAALGYSCAGEVIGLGDDIAAFRVGDLVACGGATAVHAEVVSAPQNLCAKVAAGVDLRYAAFATIAAIALQGVRQADLRLGETCAVIGLGLLGQLTMQLLDATGAFAIGIDIDARKVELAKQLGAPLALSRKAPDLQALIDDYTGGHGVDAVIIAAATSSLDPVELAGALCRKKGKVVIVGDVPTGFSRENYYRKELELRMSCSYGPGRYDARYEDKGIDYPIGYVRWTENRNMQAFLALLKNKKINLEPLITHTFAFKEAHKAYQLILNKTETSLGILLKYDVTKTLRKTIPLISKPCRKEQPQIGFIGAGAFAQNYLLPEAKKYGDLISVATASGHTARHVADKYGFASCAANAKDLLSENRLNTVFIATRHNLHAELAIEALRHGKHVFVEKPLCMTGEELEEIRMAYEKSDRHLMMGFNRRFSPFIEKVKSTLPPALPKAIHYRINAGQVPSDHWIQDPDIGGGRIIGEVCHFVDLAMFLANGRITSVAANALQSSPPLRDTLVVNLAFDNGSVAAISYFSNGSKKLNKEHLEVFCGGQVAVIDDFKELCLYHDKISKTSGKQDKGHSEEIKQFLAAIEKGLPCPIPFAEIYLSTKATLAILKSISEKKIIAV
jgi:polar amino acid transport system substrate-binding protein